MRRQWGDSLRGDKLSLLRLGARSLVATGTLSRPHLADIFAFPSCGSASGPSPSLSPSTRRMWQALFALSLSFGRFSLQKEYGRCCVLLPAPPLPCPRSASLLPLLYPLNPMVLERRRMAACRFRRRCTMPHVERDAVSALPLWRTSLPSFSCAAPPHK